jgi:alkylated DNA repair dioxygenase AlkB
MIPLFSAEANYPEGFNYLDNFISSDEEQFLVQYIHSLPLKTFLFRGYPAKRKVASYGYDYHFDSRTIKPGEKIPEQFNFIIRRCAKYFKIPFEDFAEVLVTEYPPGSVINWHRDAPPFGIVIGVSLLCDCKFRIRPYKKEKQGRGSIKTLLARRRSVYIMANEVRDQWEHSIDKVPSTRYSITLRTLR